MKKLFLFSAAISCFSLFASATETKLFTGDTAPSLFSRMDVISWAVNDANIVGNYVNYGTDAAPSYTEIAANPDKTGLNTSDMALHVTSIKGKSWWPDFFNFDLTDPITITESNRYLHVYHYRENLNKGFALYLGGGTLPEDPMKGKTRFDGQLSKAGAWEDIVVDLKYLIDNGQTLSTISFLMDANWGSDSEQATNYYFDEIVLSDNPLPRGVNILTDKEMSLFFGNETSYNKWVKNIDMQNTENTYSIVDNPFTTQTDVLNSTKIFKFDKSANAAWWQGPRVVLPGILPVGTDGNASYLHLMVNIPTMDESMVNGYVVQLNAKDYKGNQIDSGDLIKVYPEDAGKWVDCVFDVTSLGYVQEFTARFDVRRDESDNYITSPAGTFYMDAAVINNSLDPRTSVVAPTGVKDIKANGVSVNSSNQAIIVNGNVSSIEIYSLLGSLVKKIVAQNSLNVIPMPQGQTYVVKTVSNDGSVYNAKVFVK